MNLLYTAFAATSFRIIAKPARSSSTYLLQFVVEVYVFYTRTTRRRVIAIRSLRRRVLGRQGLLLAVDPVALRIRRPETSVAVRCIDQWLVADPSSCEKYV